MVDRIYKINCYNHLYRVLVTKVLPNGIKGYYQMYHPYGKCYTETQKEIGGFPFDKITKLELTNKDVL